jgi:catalase
MAVSPSKPAAAQGAKSPAKPPKAPTSGQPSSPSDEKSMGQDNAKTADLSHDRVQPGQTLTTNQGLKIADDQNSLKASSRGPTLLEDFLLREKITHFDHERIPERVVHARGAGAHGVFKVYEDLSDLTTAGFLTDPGRETPVFVRISTVAGSRGSADTPRDVRGFAVKFYTDEGVFDIVGNNMPVFFIQDAIKFPDLIHAVKPEPNNEIPQAASAHDTFYDFLSLTPEAAHMLMWVMSDRALPRSLSMMEGFGIHTFRLINAEGKSRFIKWHWKPLKGVHSLVWDESQKIAGKDADFLRRDLFESIERGDYPQWELGIQVVEEEDEFKFDFDLLDPTKIIPEDLVPVRRIGLMTLNRNPENYFAETEQVAFCLSHIVPGIDFSNDPLLQGRLFSYLDTQLKRVGPNFAELPINRPLCPVSNNQRDAQARVTINPGRVAYFPNSLGGGCPMQTGKTGGGFVSYSEHIDGAKIRARSDSFSDHFSQATMFFNSMSDWEKMHIAEAISFELNQVETEALRDRTMNEIVVNISDDLARMVSQRTGIAVKPAGTPENPTPSAPDPSGPLKPSAKNLTDSQLSQDKPSDSIKGRKVAVLGGDGIDAEQLAAIKARLEVEGALMELIAPHAGTITDSAGKAQKVNRAAPNAPSVVYDAVIAPGGVPDAASDGLAIHFVNEAFRHGKPIAAIGGGSALLDAASFPADADGVVSGEKAKSVLDDFVEALKQHRFPQRDISSVPG